MPNYRRLYIPGSTVFLTWVTHQRAPILVQPHSLNILRKAVSKAKKEAPFEIIAAAILPDHVHFVWQLPEQDSNYSKRVSRIKVLFTRGLRSKKTRSVNVSQSRRKHRESDVWQRRFWERTIRDEKHLVNCLDYVHYNPVKHGLVSCPHLCSYSSFQKWVDAGRYSHNWGCQCKQPMRSTEYR
ncbi:MAG: transposase [Cyanobacteria bacterium P01_F01_bin.13]